MNGFASIFRLACITLFICLFALKASSQLTSVTLDHNTTINDATYANSYILVKDGATPTVVSIENGADIAGISGAGVLNIKGGQIGSFDWEVALDFGGTVNYYGGTFRYGPLNIYGTMNLYAPLNSWGDPAVQGNGTINIFSDQPNRIQAANISVLSAVTVNDISFTGQATISNGTINGLSGSGVATITGGAVHYGPLQNFSGIMNIYGGVVSSASYMIGTGITGIANVYSGLASIYLSSGGNANFYGGSGSGECSPNSTLNFRGGNFIAANDGGTINVYGGTFHRVLALDGVTNFYGSGLQYDAANNIVTGCLRDGTLIDCSVFTQGSPVINLINNPPASVSGSILFSELVVNAPEQNVTFTFRPANGAAPITQTIAVSPFGAFTVPNLPRQAGILHIKPDKFLATNIAVDLSGGSVTGINAKVTPGDANNDNFCDSTDFGLLIGAYGGDANAPGSGYDPTADFNGDGFVDSSDFGILIGNFNSVGAP